MVRILKNMLKIFFFLKTLNLLKVYKHFIKIVIGIRLMKLFEISEQNFVKHSHFQEEM